VLFAIVTAALLAQQPPATTPRLLDTELAVGLGVTGTGYAYEGGRRGDFFVDRLVDGRLVLEGFTFDTSASFPMETRPGGASTGVSAVARIGWTGRRWSVVAGASLQFVPLAEPSRQWLPSLRASYSFGGWGLSAGIFDHYAMAPAHLTLEVGNYGVGYVAPLGALLTARFRLRDFFGVRVAAMAYRLFNTEVAMVTVCVSAGPGWGLAPAAVKPKPIEQVPNSATVLPGAGESKPAEPPGAPAPDAAAPGGSTTPAATPVTPTSGGSTTPAATPVAPTPSGAAAPANPPSAGRTTGGAP
jgi:hypothetical protein